VNFQPRVIADEAQLSEPIHKEFIPARVVPIISSKFPGLSSELHSPISFCFQVCLSSAVTTNPSTRQIGGKTRAHDELRSASCPFQFLGQNTVKHGWQTQRSQRLVRGDTPLTHEVPSPTWGDGSLFATRGRDGEFCSTFLNRVIHLCDPACVQQRRSEGNDPQRPTQWSGTTTDQFNTAGRVRVSTSSDLRH